MPEQHKVRESRLRRMADDQGLILRESRAHDEQSRYQLVNVFSGGSVIADPLGQGHPFHSLDEVEEWLIAEKEQPGHTPAPPDRAL